MVLTRTWREELELAARLLYALSQGPVENHGGIICYFHTGKFTSLKMNRGDMYRAVQCLNSLGINVERTDAGGTPTWELV